MKPFIALAASAPFLLLAGVGHAGTFSFSDANCSSFSIDANGVISCASQSTTTPTTTTTTTPTTTTTTTPTTTTTTTTTTSPVGSCPSTPAGTIIIAIGGKDNYASKDFDVVFDNPGATFDTAVAAGQSKALQFTNGKSLEGYVSSAAGNYGNGYKDWALSLCPGDFTPSLGDRCVLSRKTSINMGYSTNGSVGCTIPANQAVYLNVRGTNGVEAGWVMQNLQTVAQ